MDPLIFDLDDFCDEWMPLKALFRLRRAYPGFKVTLFTIPGKTSTRMLRELNKLGWIQIAVHGFNHSPNEEMPGKTRAEIVTRYADMDLGPYVPGFRPPGWTLPQDTVDACNDLGWWVAMHPRDWEKAEGCLRGAYVPLAEYDCWHGHTHEVCGNFVNSNLEDLLHKWSADQKFLFASDGVKVYGPALIVEESQTTKAAFGRLGISLQVRPNYADAQVAKEVVWKDCYRLERLLGSGAQINTIVDIGGHIGSFSLLASYLWPTARVDAFEPWPETYELLTLNCCKRSNHISHQAAVLGVTQGVELFKGPTSDNGGNGRVVREGAFPLVPAVSIDDVLSDVGGRIDLLKLDCEGSEIPILQRLSDLGLLDRIGWVRGEWHGGQPGRDAVERLLSPTHNLTLLKTYETVGLFFGSHRG